MRSVLGLVFVLAVAPMFGDEIEELVGKLGSEDWRQRREVAKKLLALAKKREERVKAALKRALDSADAQTREEAEKLLERIGWLPNKVLNGLMMRVFGQKEVDAKAALEELFRLCGARKGEEVGWQRGLAEIHRWLKQNVTSAVRVEPQPSIVHYDPAQRPPVVRFRVSAKRIMLLPRDRFFYNSWTTCKPFGGGIWMSGGSVEPRATTNSGYSVPPCRAYRNKAVLPAKGLEVEMRLPGVFAVRVNARKRFQPLKYVKEAPESIRKEEVELPASKLSMKVLVLPPDEGCATELFKDCKAKADVKMTTAQGKRYVKVTLTIEVPLGCKKTVLEALKKGAAWAAIVADEKLLASSRSRKASQNGQAFTFTMDVQVLQSGRCTVYAGLSYLSTSRGHFLAAPAVRLTIPPHK